MNNDKSFALLRSCQPARLLKVLAKIFFLYKNSRAQWEVCSILPRKTNSNRYWTQFKT